MKSLIIPALLLGLISPPIAAGLQVAVELQGVDGLLRQNVLAFLDLERLKDSPRLTPTMVRRLYQQAPRQVSAALEPLGYYHSRLDSDLQQSPVDPDHWSARFQIDPGSQMRITELDVRLLGPGATDAQLLATTRQLPLQADAPLDHGQYDEAKKQLLESAHEMGYLRADFAENRIQIDLEHDQAAIHLHLQTGPLYRFGDLTFNQDLFSDHFLQPYLKVKRGDPLRPADLAEMRRTINATGYFEQVLVQMDMPDDPAQVEVPVRIDLIPLKPNQYRFRAGYGTDSGIGLRANWLRRYLNAEGHQFDLGSILVQEKTKAILDFNYKIPIDFSRNERWEAIAHYQGKDITATDVGIDGGGETRIHQLSFAANRHQYWNWFPGLKIESSYGINLIYEQYSGFDLLYGGYATWEQELIRDGIHTPHEVDLLNPEFLGLVPELQWQYRETDDPLYPSDGWQFKGRLKGALKGMGANFTFMQTLLEGHYISSPVPGARLILRGQMGYTVAETASLNQFSFYGENKQWSLNQLPEAYEFRTGGDRSVRGYAYESLVPADSLSGGKHLLVGSLEWEQQVYGDWSVAAFYDIGNAFNEVGSMSLKTGVGGGLRWQSPVGLVRLDLAFGLDNEVDDWRIHFTIGPEF